MKYSLQVWAKKAIILVKEIPHQNSLEISFKVTANNYRRNLQITVRIECDPQRLHNYFSRNAYDQVLAQIHESLQNTLRSLGSDSLVHTNTIGLGHDFLRISYSDEGTNPTEKLAMMLMRFQEELEENIKKLNEHRRKPPPSNPNPYASPAL